ncbi:MAG TPA: neuraminidase-like domain-containing protein [Ktedonobacteraceae bacterium]
MANSNYLVARLTPSSPVDGITFATYLEDLTIQVYPANAAPGTPSLGSTVYSSPLLLTPGGTPQSYLAVTSRATAEATARDSSNNTYGDVLKFASTKGIMVGAWLFSPEDQPLFPAGLIVKEVKEDSIILNNSLPAYVPANTIVGFVLNYDNITPWSTDPPILTVHRTTSADALKDATSLPLASTQGIAAGMTVSPQSGIINTQTTVRAVDQTSVTLSKPLLGKLPKNTDVTFTFELSSGIIQHIETNGFTIPGFNFGSINSASVATAIIELNSPPPPFLDISVLASRSGKQIPVETTYYNVLVSPGSPPTPDQYQAIPPEDTSFYLTLPAPPLSKHAISLLVPDDGTPPAFDVLEGAITDILQADPSTLSDPPIVLPTNAAAILAYIGKNGLTADQCKKIAYEIVWSQQNVLPIPPDPLEDLYTNPPNTGTSKSDDEQDRQKFEGNLKSYYATRNAEAQRLTGFVYSLAAALFAEQMSKDATSVRFTFPIIDDSTTLTTIQEAAVTFTNQGLPINQLFTAPGSSALGFAVPAEYFYVLGVGLPPQVAPRQQYQMATHANKQQILDKLHNAIKAGIIASPALTPDQAARNLATLAMNGNSDPECPLDVYTDIQALAQTWLTVSGGDDALDTFWKGVVTADPTNPQIPPDSKAKYLDLILCLVTNNFKALSDAIKTTAFSVKTVADLAQIPIQNWETFFNGNASLLPPFTAPGSLKQPTPTDPKVIKRRADVFVRHLQSFFEVTASVSQMPSVDPHVPPTLYREDASLDPILEFIGAYPGFSLDPNLDPRQQVFQDALDAVFSNDPPARAWLEQTILALNAVYVLTTGIPQPSQPAPAVLPDLRFSVMEALYARGFTSLQSVLDLSPDDFQQALTGTVAYPYASLIQANAGTWQTGGSPQGAHQPINPGCLVNCVPPLYLSPLGPVAYLYELLKLSAASMCENPWPILEEGEMTLADALALRHGSPALLDVTDANLTTPLPLIDLVNERLEALAAGVQNPLPTYNTASDTLDGYALCSRESQEEDDSHQVKSCHTPTTLFETLPAYSSPATPVALPAAYDRLKSDFSACCLPYSQALDISRSYLRYLGTNRYAAMRRFRKEITEFVLDPSAQPADFQSQLWRYPVRIEIAREYLGISPEEYTLLFTQDISAPALAELYGIDPVTLREMGGEWIEIVLPLSEFLKRTCLTYCEFLDLWKVVSLYFQKEDEGKNPPFPPCEPCCLDLEQYRLHLGNPQATLQALKILAVFIRLWRKLQEVKGARYSFAELGDISEVLQLVLGDGTINPDFIRQLAAFQMLRDNLDLRLHDGPARSTSATTAEERTPLLALWVGTGASTWNQAVEQLLDHIQHYAQVRHQRGRRKAEFLKLIAQNLDPLSLLAGFDPGSTNDTWHASPTHTLRFAEVLSKVYASDFSVGELLFLFTVSEHLDGDDPLPLEEENETLDFPLNLPDDDEEHSLWKLRHKLLTVQVSEHEVTRWTWQRIEAALRNDFGFIAPASGPDPLQSFVEHFFPEMLEASGFQVDALKRQYRTTLASAKTTPLMWNTQVDSPFRYDTDNAALWMYLPLTDEALCHRLSHLRQLGKEEQQAVQNLYFAPRVDLAPFAFLFTDFSAAEERLIQERDEARRWAFFQQAFALCHARCQIIAEHLAHHVASATGQDCPAGTTLAWSLLRHLLADENRVATWENDDGTVPAVPWPQPTGGAFAALLGLTGTGLHGKFTTLDDTPAWNEVRGSLSPFGRQKDHWNAPVPTLLPAMEQPSALIQKRLVGIRNGFAIKADNSEPLGGAQGFRVHWQGMLLIEREGTYEFQAGAPTPDCEAPDFEAAEHRHWHVTLRRGQKTWIILSHLWPNAQEISNRHGIPLSLRRGFYQLTIEFTQPQPPFDRPEEIHPQHTGFQVKYAGPDSDGQLIALPSERLYREKKDGTLDDGQINFDKGSAARKFLQLHFTSSLRDIRRTYQRAFKALLFAHRFELSARLLDDYEQSELGYLLDHAERFEGRSYYHLQAGFGTHCAFFNFNFLPLLDTYHAPTLDQDQRVQPSAKRQQALFDWWERVFDYTQMRRETQSAREHPLWLLFEEATEGQPDNPAQLLRHMGVDLGHAPLVLNYLQASGPAVYTVTSDDLEDERWAVRVWRAEQWLRELLRHFATQEISSARPALWVADDPNQVMAPEPLSGNANLTRFVDTNSFDSGAPRRYKDIKRLNDGLRERARRALLVYLCSMQRVPLPWQGFASEPKDLSALLLLDVEAGICEKASRIEDAISAVQIYVQRCRLNLEKGVTLSPEFVRLWERRFATFRVWEASKRREIYRENWIDWEAMQQAQNTETFRFLAAELQQTVLSAPAAGGLEYWPDQPLPAHPEVTLLQRHEPSHLRQLPQSSNPDGFALRGAPERAAHLSWLAALQNNATTEEGGTGVIESAGSRAVLTRNNGTQPDSMSPLPLWIQTAIQLGVDFVRVAAAGEPPASLSFTPHQQADKAGYCATCGKVHGITIDEYYFWLLDSRYYREPSPGQDAAWDWENQAILPELLLWNAEPTVYLAWCRVHNGEFQQPRRSDEGIPFSDTGVPPLNFLGRARDSLTFSCAPISDPSTPFSGFRYDLATDTALVLPLVSSTPPQNPPAPNPPYPAGLAAYPYFIYFAPGAPLALPGTFAPALVVAGTLRTHCRFEAALKWYELAFNPLREDCAWVECLQREPVPAKDGALPVHVTPVAQPVSQHARGAVTRVLPPETSSLAGRKTMAVDDSPTIKLKKVTVIDGKVVPETPGSETASSSGAPAGNEAPGAVAGVTESAIKSGSAREGRSCCQSLATSEQDARNRSIVLHYLETLLQWGDAFMRHNSDEAFQQARLIFDTAAVILGAHPRSIKGSEAARSNKDTQKVAGFLPTCAPLNPRLLDLYDLVDDRLALIHTCLDSRRLREGRWSYWGNDPLRDGWQTARLACADEEDGCCAHSPYRFLFLLQKAQELASQTKELGSALLAAFEKGDAEYLASLRALHERQLLDLTLEIRKNQWREADWQVQALKKTQEGVQARRQYNALLIQNGLISGEVQHETLTDVTLSDQESSRILEAIGAVLGLIPDIHAGTVDFATIPLGTKLQGVFSAMSQITNSQAGSASTTGSFRLTQAGWDRREAEWRQQVQVLDIENDQIERQILAAERRRDIALRELNNHQQQMEHAEEILDFLRDKFTNHALYLYLQQETAALYGRMYELALCTARQAQRAFKYERGHTTRRFLPNEVWETLHQGLLAGERLQLSLRQMEKAYLDENTREYELSKHFSLRLHFPLEFLRLKATGRCELVLPEWMFDFDYPGHYMRRIKNVTLTLPCVVGPYTGIHCRLTLLSSTTRVDPRLMEPLAVCCDEDDYRNGYQALPEDPRMVTQYAATEAIATSSGQNDSGLFELNFRDERYLPFEFAGAISRWRVELPPENNQFDLDTLSDVILHLNYTAREGGEIVRREANEVAQRHLPGAGLRFFDVKHELADTWHRFQGMSGDERSARHLPLRLSRDMFPFIPGHWELRVNRLEIFFQAPEAEPGAHHRVAFLVNAGLPGDQDEKAVHDVECIASTEWPGLYHGVLDLPLGPLGQRGNHELGTLVFPLSADLISRVFLVCQYEASRRKSEERLPFMPH